MLQLITMTPNYRKKESETRVHALLTTFVQKLTALKTLCVLLLLFIVSQSFAQITDERRILPEHPRLIFMKGSERDVHQLIKRDKRMLKLHNHVISTANSILSVPCNERIKTGIRLLPVSRKNIKHIIFLSYAYRMTGDTKYAERAKAELIKLSNFSDWNPSHFLDVAEMGLAAAIGYDWLYDYLDTETKALVENAIVEKIITPACGKYVFNMSRTNNWNQVCNTGTSIAALAIYEKIPQQTIDILNRAIQNLPKVMKEYAPNGAYIEGYGYWGYGTTYNVILIDLLQKLFGQDYGLKSQEGFMKTGKFHESLVTPALNYYNYGDNKNIPATSITPIIFWFYKETKDQDLLYNAKQILSYSDQLVNERDETERFIPLTLVWAGEAGINLKKVKAPKYKTYQGFGVNPIVCFRSSWRDKDGAFIGFKGGKDRISHGHQDAGSFIYEVDQVRWALELGQEDYNKLETARLSLWGKDRWKVYRYNCFNHNMYTFNGQPILEKQFIKLDSIKETADEISCQADLSALFSNQVVAAKRKIALVNKRDCWIDDVIQCGEKDVVICWRMASEAERMSQIDDHSILLYKGDKKIQLTVTNHNQAPEGIVFSLKPAESKNAYDSPNPGIKFVEFSLTLKANSENKLRVTLEP